MNRLDRMLGILLALQEGQTVSATALARQFEVSTRTVYRDIEALAAVGAPVYAEMGREGGFRLLEGYFMPPVMFSPTEAVSLLFALTMLRSLRNRPFATELDTAMRKLLAATPPPIQQVLTQAEQVIGFEATPADVFHVDVVIGAVEVRPKQEGAVVAAWVQAILDRRAMSLDYRPAFREASRPVEASPQGVIWDRDRWYLVGRRLHDHEQRLWRADRVHGYTLLPGVVEVDPGFDVRSMLDRAWLRQAMQEWAQQAPVKIRLTSTQATRLQQDWYYQHAQFEPDGPDHVIMTYGDIDQRIVLELLRWLGPGAELLAPQAWRSAVVADLTQMLAVYAS